MLPFSSTIRQISQSPKTCKVQQHVRCGCKVRHTLSDAVDANILTLVILKLLSEDSHGWCQVPPAHIDWGSHSSEPPLHSRGCWLRVMVMMNNYDDDDNDADAMHIYRVVRLWFINLVDMCLYSEVRTLRSWKIWHRSKHSFQTFLPASLSCQPSLIVHWLVGNWLDTIYSFQLLKCNELC